jgi:hypothetical protein
MRRVGTILAIVLAAVVSHAGETLDRVVARVDRHAIMRSDVEQEARFSRLVEGQGGDVTVHDEIAALERLIDRDLIADQIVVFGAIPVSKTEIEARISEMRKQIPNAESDSEWLRLLRENGLTPQDVENEVAQELRTLRFIDMRFRSEVRVGQRSLQTYYDTKFVPEMKAKGLAPLPLDQVQDQIETILREERVNALISDWLKTLRNQSRIKAFDPALPLTDFGKKTPDVSDVHFLPLHITGPAEAEKR